MEFKCNECRKYYKSYQSLWNHNKKFHTNNIPIKSSNIPIKSSNIFTDIPIKSSIIENNTCVKCYKQLSSYKNKWRHEKTCKKIDTNKIIDKLKMENQELSNKYNELLKLCKIHPKTLQKINKNLINSNNNNNTNNGTINNTVNIVKFGTEDLASILSKSEIFKILNRKLSSLEESIKLIHFNNDRPELKNIYITNLKDQYAYSYDGNKFVASLKSDVLNELVDNHIENIEYSLEEYKNKLQPKTIELLDKFIEKMNNDDDEFIDKEHRKKYPNYKSFSINKIKMMIYNESNKNVVSVICDKHEQPTEIIC